MTPESPWSSFLVRLSELSKGERGTIIAGAIAGVFIDGALVDTSFQFKSAFFLFLPLGLLTAFLVTQLYIDGVFSIPKADYLEAKELFYKALNCEAVADQMGIGDGYAMAINHLAAYWAKVETFKKAPGFVMLNVRISPKETGELSQRIRAKYQGHSNGAARSVEA